MEWNLEGGKAMTIPQAKKIVGEFLDTNKLPYTKLGGRTISFVDLGRSSCIFIRVHGWQPGPKWNELQSLAKQNGFCVEQ